MHRTEESSPMPLLETRVLSSLELGGRCLLDSYRLVRRIQRGCELTKETCRLQRQALQEQREFLKGLHRDLTSGDGAPEAGMTEHGFDGGARAVE